MAKIKHMLKEAIEAVQNKKTFDIKLLDISELSSIADYFLICSANNERQVQSASDEVERKMKDNEFNVLNIEGYRSGRWILMDLGDVVVHIFHKEDRDFYNLDRLWVDAENIDIDNII
ncbi:ribosome silencing factor [Abyssisolibacter fermentans]|uniref:ribosome silencing factor n=1 Tax=Abyssisolibacter fermentans TaxID=1766203 RepID=UPI000A4DF9DE|nr:ribosome silencing factor [Abyssisolibacter fermentans]